MMTTWSISFMKKYGLQQTTNRDTVHRPVHRPVHVKGDLIVRIHLQLEKHGLSRLFSFKLWTLYPPSRQSGTLGSLLLRI